MTNRPLVGISIILIKKNKILLGLRKNSHGNGTWGMAGGHLEWKENFFKCAKREAMEELGVSIKCHLKPIFITNDFFTKENKHYITIFIIANIKKGTIQNKEPHKCIKWEWFNYKKLPKSLFLPVKNLIKQESIMNLFIK